jgi:hypothetical protein
VQYGNQTLLHRVGAAAASAGGGTAKRPRLRRAVGIALTILVLAFLVGAVASQWTELREHELAFDAVWLGPALVVLVALHALAAFGWDLTLAALGHQLRPVRAQSIWAQSLLARYVPGSLLAVVTRVLPSEREGVPRRTTLATLVYEQGLMFVSAVMISASALIGDSPLGTAAQIALLCAAPLLLAAMHPRVFGPIANRVLRPFGREPLPVLLPLRTVLALLCFYLAVWAVFGVGAFLAARTVFELGLADLPAVTTAQALGYSVALATVIFPGGLGVRDATFALVLDRALPGGFALAAAIAIAVRLVTTVAEVIYATGAMLLGRRTKAPAAGAVHEAT